MSEEEPMGCLEWLCFKKWQPFKALRNIVITSFIMGLVFLIFAVVLFIVYVNTFEQGVPYSTNGKCLGSSSNNTCHMVIEIAHDLNPPILMMYSIRHAYINHRRYITSISAPQLDGSSPTMQARPSA